MKFVKYDTLISLNINVSYSLHQLRESLEESISQLQSQRLSRSTGARSASASTSPLHTSDLDACSGSGLDRRQFLFFSFPFCSLGENNVRSYSNVSDGQRFYPTSPRRDYTDAAHRRTRRRSHSACVRFKDARGTEEDVRNSKPGCGSLPLATVMFPAWLFVILTGSSGQIASLICKDCVSFVALRFTLCISPWGICAVISRGCLRTSIKKFSGETGSHKQSPMMNDTDTNNEAKTLNITFI